MKMHDEEILNSSLSCRLRQCAFTLIELLVVIAVILILMGISLKMMSIVSNKTGISKTLFVLEQTRNALDAYYATVGSYPNTTDIRYDRFAGSTNSWGFDASAEVKKYEKYGLTYYIGYEAHPRAASWQKFASTVIGSGGSHTNRPIPKIGFDTIITTNTVNTICDAWGREIVYVPNASCDGYVLSSLGLDGQTNTADDIGITKNE
jgi:prepilin-type N-terminal cleavage/methylation domain-containing protein